MSEIVAFLQENGRTLMSAAALVLLLAALVIQAVLLVRTRRLQRTLDGITEKVAAYLAVVMAPDEEGAAPVDARPQPVDRSEEENSRLISAVLQEIFP